MGLYFVYILSAFPAVGVLGAFWSDWVLAAIAGNLTGVPSSCSVLVLFCGEAFASLFFLEKVNIYSPRARDPLPTGWVVEYFCIRIWKEYKVRWMTKKFPAMNVFVQKISRPKRTIIWTKTE